VRAVVFSGQVSVVISFFITPSGMWVRRKD